MRILIVSAIVFGIFAISLGVIPADATTYRGSDWGIIEFSEHFDSDDDRFWAPDQPVTVILTDPDMNKDPTVSEKIIFSNAYDSVLEPHPDIPVEDFMYKLCWNSTEFVRLWMGSLFRTSLKVSFFLIWREAPENVFI